jgi:hypothetical protein
MGFLGWLFAKEDTSLPPVPKWRPNIAMPIERIIDRFKYYTDGKRDFVVFAHGTIAVVSEGLTDEQAVAEAKGILSQVFSYHPDMKPLSMDDGNILIQYNHPANNVVLMDVVKSNWNEIEKRHLDALARSEVLITPLGPNKFDDFSKAALFGRCFFFMDAQDPKAIKVVRKTASE